MESMSLFFKIYELKGYIESMSGMAEYDEQYHNPLLDKVEVTMKEIIQQIENKDA